MFCELYFVISAHSPDNSFMGFVVENHLNKTDTVPVKLDQAVVYGKAEFMWQVGYLNYPTPINQLSTQWRFLSYWPIGHKLLAWPGVGIIVDGSRRRCQHRQQFFQPLLLRNYCPEDFKSLYSWCWFYRTLKFCKRILTDSFSKSSYIIMVS